LQLAFATSQQPSFRDRVISGTLLLFYWQVETPCPELLDGTGRSVTVGKRNLAAHSRAAEAWLFL
jgi:hypothetical protein